MNDYASFLHSKTQLDSAGGFEPTTFPTTCSAFSGIWSIGRSGRDVGAVRRLRHGQDPMELVWAQNVHKHTGKPVLLVTPLAVGFQIEQEAQKFGADAAVSRNGSTPASSRSPTTNVSTSSIRTTSPAWCATSPVRSKRLTVCAERR